MIDEKPKKTCFNFLHLKQVSYIFEEQGTNFELMCIANACSLCSFLYSTVIFAPSFASMLKSFASSFVPSWLKEITCVWWGNALNSKMLFRSDHLTFFTCLSNECKKTCFHLQIKEFNEVKMIAVAYVTDAVAKWKPEIKKACTNQCYEAHTPTTNPFQRHTPPVCYVTFSMTI